MLRMNCDNVIRREQKFDKGSSYLYELVMRHGDATANWQTPLYSVRIYMVDPFGNNRQADARDIFSDKDDAEAFFDKIVRNLATPIDLAYILEDEFAS